MEALIGLGFPVKQAEPAVEAVLVHDPDLGTSQALRAALGLLGKNR